MNVLIITILASFVISLPFFIKDVFKSFIVLKSLPKINYELPVSPPLVSIIIPAWNEEEYVEKCLDPVLAQEYEPKEIITIAGGNDKTLEIANGYRKKGIKVIKQEAKGKNAALNSGVDASKGDIIITLDADCIVPKNWLFEIIKPFGDEDVKIVAGTWKSEESNIYTKNNEFYQEVGYVFDAKGFWGSNTAFRRDILNKVNFFDKDVSAGVELDLYLTLRKVVDDRNIVHNENAFVYTWWPSTFKSFFKTSIRWARAQLEISKKHRLTQIMFPFLISAFLVLMPISIIVIFFIEQKFAFVLFYSWIFVLSWKIFRNIELAMTLSIATRKIRWLKEVYIPLFTSHIGYVANTIAFLQFLIGKKQDKVFEHGR